VVELGFAISLGIEDAVINYRKAVKHRVVVTVGDNSDALIYVW
jgi:hypothetical protein